jgi:glycogen debranching enzyme
MYGHSNFRNYGVDFPPGALRQAHVSNDGHSVVFYCPSAVINPFIGPETVCWWYKCGTGERTERNDDRGPATIFVGEHHEVAAFFNLEFTITRQRPLANIYFSCSATTRGRTFSLADLRRLDTASLRRDRRQLRSIERLVPLGPNPEFRSRVLARIIGLTKFKICVRPSDGQNYVQVPYAGAWWFKTPWYRDIFEGILSNFRVFMSLEGEREAVRQVLLLAYSQQDTSTGLIPNRMSEFRGIWPTYNSVDSTLLFFMTGNRYVSETKDHVLARVLLSAAIITIRGLISRESEAAQEDGPPRIHSETGLLLTAPHHSWIDTRSQHVDYAGLRFDRLPSRLGLPFVKDLYDAIGGESLVQTTSSPAFFLPEINAQWIVALGGLMELVELALSHSGAGEYPAMEDLRRLQATLQCFIARAKNSYLSIFWAERSSFLFNAVYRDLDIRDNMKCEAAITATAMLGESVFAREQLQRIWQRASEVLLVSRYVGGRAMSFGVRTTRAEFRIFYGDHEYHGDVVWPRSTPYLITLLRMLDRKDSIRDLLANNLDHQMTEGAIFYNHEILARPSGKNIDADPSTSRNPVPVKNPIQFWSQWCDPFITFMEETANGERIP